MKMSTAKATFGVLLTTGAMAAGVVLASGIADAAPTFGPFVAPIPSGGPWNWCPGEPLNGGIDPSTKRGSPGPMVNWDMTQCHTWYYVNWG